MQMIEQLGEVVRIKTFFQELRETVAKLEDITRNPVAIFYREELEEIIIISRSEDGPENYNVVAEVTTGYKFTGSTFRNFYLEDLGTDDDKAYDEFLTGLYKTHKRTM